ncbi:MAG: hypothetical protein ACFNM7_07435, partial [Prevotella conceptionensis]
SRENRFIAARLAIGDENGAHSVKNYADKLTKASPPTPLKKGKASPPTPLQGERGVICVVGWQGLTPGDCQACGGLFETGISVVADHIYNGKRDALCCYG